MCKFQVTVELEYVSGVNRDYGQKGFIDITGKLVIPFEYEHVGYAFSDGLVYVGEYNPDGGGNVFGYMDKAGEVVIPFDYADVEPFFNGMAIVRSKDSMLYGVIDKAGNTVIPLEYGWIKYYSNGLATTSKDGKWGVIDKTGSVVIPFEYDDLGWFSEGLASFSKDGRIGYIDIKGNVVISLDYEPSDAGFTSPQLSSFRNGFAIVYAGNTMDGSLMQPHSTAKWGIIDKTGEEVVPREYDYISSFSGGIAVTFKGYADFYHGYFRGTWGIVQIVDNSVIPS